MKTIPRLRHLAPPRACCAPLTRRWRAHDGAWPTRGLAPACDLRRTGRARRQRRPVAAVPLLRARANAVGHGAASPGTVVAPAARPRGHADAARARLARADAHPAGVAARPESPVRCDTRGD